MAVLFAVVATVDNLAAPIPPRAWPVASHRSALWWMTKGTQAPRSAANAARLVQCFLTFAEAVPLDSAVALYARLYPLFQQARNEELGTPNRYFNDRLVAVLDHLLLAPGAAGLLRKLTPVNTDIAQPAPMGAV